jgi:hypothetical protein
MAARGAVSGEPASSILCSRANKPRTSEMLFGLPNVRLESRLFLRYQQNASKCIRNGWQPGPITDQSRESGQTKGRSPARYRTLPGPSGTGGTIEQWQSQPSARARSALGGLLLLMAVGLAFYARHWLSLAGRSRVGARSEDEVQRALAPLQAEGWRLRHSLPWQGSGDIDSVAIAPNRSGGRNRDEDQDLRWASPRAGARAGGVAVPSPPPRRSRGHLPCTNARRRALRGRRPGDLRLIPVLRVAARIRVADGPYIS